MTIFTEQQLVSDIRKAVRPCYQFYGADVATLEATVKKLIKKLLPSGAEDLNYHFFPAGGFDIDALGDAAMALPIFSDRVVIAVNDLNAGSLTPKDMAALKGIITDLDPETTTLIFYATAIDMCGGKKSLTEPNKKLAEHIFKSGGAVCEFSVRSESDIVKYIERQTEQEGSHISQEAARLLSRRCKGDLLMIKNEVQKLSAYRFGGEISVGDVEELVTGQIEADAYKLARLITEGKSAEAFDVLNRLYMLQKETLSLTSAVSGSLLDLYRAKLALMSGRSEQDVAKLFNYKGREFAVRYALRDCQRIPIERLRRCISVMAECDAGIKSLRTDDRVLFEEAVTKMLSEV